MATSKSSRLSRGKARAKSKTGRSFFGSAVSSHRISSSPVKRSSTKRSSSKRQKLKSKKGERFVEGLVFVAMSFQGKGMEEAFSAIKDSCRLLKLNARRVDENASSGFIILEIIDLIERDFLCR